MSRRTAYALAAAVPLTLAAGGCLVVSGSESIESGVRVSNATLDNVEVGTTTEAWLIATLGEPTRRCVVPDRENVEMLVYEYEKRRSSGGAVFLIFAGGKSQVHRSVAYFEVTDGIVSRSWVEVASE